MTTEKPKNKTQVLEMRADMLCDAIEEGQEKIKKINALSPKFRPAMEHIGAMQVELNKIYRSLLCS